MHVWKGLKEFPQNVRPWRQQNPKPHHATRHSRLEPVSATFWNGFFFCFRRLRWLGPWRNSLEFTAWGMEFQDLRLFRAIFCRTFGAQNFTIQVTLGTAAWTSGSLSESVCKISYRLCVLNHGTPHLVTSNEKLESLMEANGFPVHCGFPCGATLCTLREAMKLQKRLTFRGGGGELSFWGGGG